MGNTFHGFALPVRAGARPDIEGARAARGRERRWRGGSSAHRVVPTGEAEASSAGEQLAKEYPGGDSLRWDREPRPRGRLPVFSNSFLSSIGVDLLIPQKPHLAAAPRL